MRARGLTLKKCTQDSHQLKIKKASFLFYDSLRIYRLTPSRPRAIYIYLFVCWHIKHRQQTAERKIIKGLDNFTAVKKTGHKQTHS